MLDYSERFLALALQANALQFGQFTLKSGRTSPYFLNTGLLYRGSDMISLATCYADAIDAENVPFDVIYGPAYKGIPLAVALVCIYANRQRTVAFAYDRKEVKNHGEGGILVGAPLSGKQVLIIDDVITAGTAISLSIKKIQAAGGRISGIALAFDRQEILSQSQQYSAVQAIHQQTSVPVVAIANFSQMLLLIQNKEEYQHFYQHLQAYRKRYGSDSSPAPLKVAHQHD